MVQTILVPLDGSALSEQAIPYAAALAKASGAQLIFMRAILTAVVAPGALTFNTTLRDRATAYLDEHVEAARKDGLKAQAHVWEDEAGYSILRMVETRRPDLIVMSTHGRSGMGRVVWGSVADYVLHHTPVPTLLVPKDAEGGWADMSRPRFVVPLDGSVLAEEALPVAEELARTFNGELALVEAIEPNAWLIDAADPWATYRYDQSLILHDAQQREAAGQHLDRVATALNARGITASVTVADGRAAKVIGQAVRDRQAYAIVMATHGRGGATRLLMGSVTDSVIHSARVPVLVVRPATAWQEAQRTEPVSKPAERKLTVALSQPELDLTRAALQQLVNSNHSGSGLVQAFDLLDRLNQVELAERLTPGSLDYGSITGIGPEELMKANPGIHPNAIDFYESPVEGAPGRQYARGTLVEQGAAGNHGGSR